MGTVDQSSFNDEDAARSCLGSRRRRHLRCRGRAQLRLRLRNRLWPQLWRLWPLLWSFFIRWLRTLFRRIRWLRTRLLLRLRLLTDTAMAAGMEDMEAMAAPMVFLLT